MKSSRKRGLLLGLGYLLLLTALLYGFYAYEMGRLGKALKEREALRAEIETHGPWVEQAIWMPADGGAYVLPPSDEPYAQPAAYFLISGEWYDFEMICGPGCILWFSDRDAEFDVPQFKSNFKLEGDTFTLHIKAAKHGSDPPQKTYLRPHQSGGLRAGARRAAVHARRQLNNTSPGVTLSHRGWCSYAHALRSFTTSPALYFIRQRGMPSEDTSIHPLPSILVSYRALSRLANSFRSIFDFSFF